VTGTLDGHSLEDRADIQGRRFGLVGCVKTKASHACPAKDLYLSPLFRGRRDYVEHSCDRWWILSALYGLVDPTQVVDPYDVTLKGASSSTKQLWSKRVLEEITTTIQPQAGDVFELHAGADYKSSGLEVGLRGLGCRLQNPTEGLTMGQQLAFYTSIQWT
jgi:hypothetical protein